MSVINKNLSLQNVPISANLEGERSKEDESNNYWHAMMPHRAKTLQTLTKH